MSNRAVFLDRDDTLINDPGYINHPSQIELLPGASQAIIQLRRMGYKTVIVSNQSAVARGIVTEEVLAQINQRLRDILAKDHAYIDAVYYCPYHPEGVIPQYRKQSDQRKPNPGMLLKAAQEMDIDLKNSWMIGNSYSDTTAGFNAGCKTILIDSPAKPAVTVPTDPKPDHVAVNIKEAANIIRMVYNQDQTSDTIPQTSTQNDTVHSPPVPDIPESSPVASPSIETQEQIPADNTPNSSAAPTRLRTVTPQKKRHTPSSPAQTDESNLLLHELLGHLKRNNRDDMYEEFSIYKLLATVTQVIVIFCLVLSLWFIMDSSRSAAAVHTAIGYAAVLQLMVIACCIMQRKK